MNSKNFKDPTGRLQICPSCGEEAILTHSCENCRQQVCPDCIHRVGDPARAYICTACGERWRKSL